MESVCSILPDMDHIQIDVESDHWSRYKTLSTVYSLAFSSVHNHSSLRQNKGCFPFLFESDRRSTAISHFAAE